MHKRKPCALHMGESWNQNARELRFRRSYGQAKAPEEFQQRERVWHGQGSVQYIEDACHSLRKG